MTSAGVSWVVRDADALLAAVWTGPPPDWGRHDGLSPLAVELARDVVMPG